MLKPRLPQSPPPPGPRVRIGEFVVDLSAREVSGPGPESRSRITSKALAVITEMAINPGQVLSRDELMDRVWTDAFPTGDVLTQAITTLRKAFADNAESPRYIETISKSGYRLIAPVQWLAEGTSHPSATPSADGVFAGRLSPDGSAMTRRGRQAGRSVVWIGVAALVLIGIGWVASSGNRATDRGDSMSGPRLDTPVVVVAGAGDDWGPRLSPDGAMMVFVSSEHAGESTRLFLQATSLAAARPLTNPAASERDLVPTWSPDGRNIVFQRHSEEAECRFMQISASGGTARELGRCASDVVLLYDWAPDGSHLVVGALRDDQRDAHVIHRLDLATGKFSALDYLTPAGSLDLEPRYSPDGRWLAFRRNLSSADLWMMPAAGGTPTRISNIATDIRGFDWSPDGQHLVLSSVSEGEHRLSALNIKDGSMTALGISAAIFPDFPLRGYELAFEVNRGQLGLATLSIQAPAQTPARVLASSASELNGEIAPDRSVVAFYSDRSGKAGVWIAPVEPDTGAPDSVPGLMPIARFNPSWSADSTRFLVIGFGTGGGGLYEVSRASLRPTQLSVAFGAPRFAAYLANDRLLVGVIADDQQSMWVAEREGNALRPLHQIESVSYGRADASGQRIFFTRVGQPGLWETDSSFSRTQSVFELWPSISGYKMWTLVDDRLLVLKQNARLAGLELLVWPLDQLDREPELRHALPEYSGMTVGGYLAGQIILTESFGSGRDIALSRFHPQASD